MLFLLLKLIHSDMNWPIVISSMLKTTCLRNYNVPIVILIVFDMKGQTADTAIEGTVFFFSKHVCPKIPIFSLFICVHKSHTVKLKYFM